MSSAFPSPVKLQGVAEQMGLVVNEEVVFRIKNGMPTWLRNVIVMLENSISLKTVMSQIPEECRRSVLEYEKWSNKERITPDLVRQWRDVHAKRRREQQDRLEKQSSKKAKKRQLDVLQQETETKMADVMPADKTKTLCTISTRDLYRAAAPVKLAADLTLEQHQELAEKQRLSTSGLVKRKRPAIANTSAQPTAFLASRLAYTEEGHEQMQLLSLQQEWKPADTLTTKDTLPARELFGRTLADPGAEPEEVLGRRRKTVRSMHFKDNSSTSTFRIENISHENMFVRYRHSTQSSKEEALLMLKDH